ncbi:ATP10 protein-domain-containing protein [Durotheca rogersii]|uniref:ATP10 protein-domain-containing protein n=1 Tax=Durotheca rogersii TaxID=419775 RepID=UPI00221E5E59|nr:ATP10 protein-domain-containing protein [Durotheca rogersii]KAI5866845.1 ATP10 protein-domain-containing protein [Durotheca rogersii]
MSFACRPRFSCLRCQSRAFSSSYRLQAEQRPSPAAQAAAKTAATSPPPPGKSPTTPPPKTIPPSPLADVPRADGERVESFTPKPLLRPIGMPNPPRPGENTGVDLRTLKQRRDDFVNYEKHLEKREELKKKLLRPYFRDWGNLSFHKGKTFIAPPRPFKRELSLFFPNLRGATPLAGDRGPRDTTPALRGRVSVVSVFSGAWAERQAGSFAAAESNPELERALERGGGRARRAWVNVEENALKRALVRLFAGAARRRVGEPDRDRYFLVARGVTDDIRERLGLLNRSVGYVYLLDADCRIRWAGSGPSEDHERRGLANAVLHLLEEEESLKKASG